MDPQASTGLAAAGARSWPGPAPGSPTGSPRPLARARGAPLILLVRPEYADRRAFGFAHAELVSESSGLSLADWALAELELLRHRLRAQALPTDAALLERVSKSRKAPKNASRAPFTRKGRPR